jgi:hypothetical protein
MRLASSNCAGQRTPSSGLLALVPSPHPGPVPVFALRELDRIPKSSIAFRPILAVLAFAALALLGCATVRKESHSSAPALPHTTTLETLESLVLLDVQGLWGGRNLWIRSNGSVIVLIVTNTMRPESGLQESRWVGQLSARQMNALGRLLEEESFLSMRVPSRDLLPDEGHPTIWARMKSGKGALVSKNSGDAHLGFDAIYEHLLRLARLKAGRQRIGKGAYDWDWHPAGFPSGEEILELKGSASVTPAPANDPKTE